MSDQTPQPFNQDNPTPSILYGHRVQYERTPHDYGAVWTAWVPDITGCYVAAKTFKEVVGLISNELEAHKAQHD